MIRRRCHPLSNLRIISPLWPISHGMLKGQQDLILIRDPTHLTTAWVKDTPFDIRPPAFSSRLFSSIPPKSPLVPLPYPVLRRVPIWYGMGVLSATQQPTWCHDPDTTPAGGGRAPSGAFVENDDYDKARRATNIVLARFMHP